MRKRKLMNALTADSFWLDSSLGKFSDACVSEGVAPNADKLDTITGSREDATEGGTPPLVKAATIDELSKDGPETI